MKLWAKFALGAGALLGVVAIGGGLFVFGKVSAFRRSPAHRPSADRGGPGPGALKRVRSIGRSELYGLPWRDLWRRPDPRSALQHGRAHQHHSPSGIKDWSYEDFDRLLTEGIKKNGEQLDPFMPIEATQKASELEKRALWAFFQSIPPKEFGSR